MFSGLALFLTIFVSLALGIAAGYLSVSLVLHLMNASRPPATATVVIEAPVTVPSGD